MPRRRAPEKRRRSAAPTNIIQVRSRLDRLERRPQLQRTRLVPVLSQMPDEVDDSYGFVDDAAPLIGNISFPEDPYDGQHFWLHHMDTREMTLFIFCEHYGKWVSPTYYHVGQVVGSFTTLAGSYASVSASDVGRVTIQNAKLLWAMGVRFEVQLAGRLTNNEMGKITDAAVARFEFDEFDSDVTFVERSLAISSNALTTSWMRDRDWHDLTTIQPVRKNAHFLFQVKRDIGTSTGTLVALSFSVRLVSAV